jgi:glycosyltransferase involved in cell wall biosynthesis
MATALAGDPKNEVVFLTKAKEGSLKGVQKLLYSPKREASAQTHHYLRGAETSILHGQAAFEVCAAARKAGFVPDLILGHAGWGPTLFLKDVFPRTPMALNFEWFYRSHGSDCDFDPSEPVNPDDEARIRMKNATLLSDLAACDGGLCPTRYQFDQFPPHLRSNFLISHEGIDTNFFKPDPAAKIVLPKLNLDLSGAKEIVTYATRGMEPYRGFPQFMEAAHLLLKQRPNAHVVVAGDDRVAYGKAAPGGKTYKQLMLEKYPFDAARFHFVGSLPYGEYVKLLQATSVHVYLTRPFVLSWSMLEAMSCGALVVASNTAPVQEVITDGVNGLMVDFFKPEEIAETIGRALDEPRRFEHLRRNARQTVLAKYELGTCLRQRMDWMGKLLAAGR